MKITWLGNTVFRIHYAGEIILLAIDDAPPDVDLQEIRAGVDRIITPADLANLPQHDGTSSSRPLRLIDDPQTGLTVRSIGDHAVMFSESSEDDLVFTWNTLDALPASGAVLILSGELSSLTNIDGISNARPTLIGLAFPETEIPPLAELAARLPGIPLQILEPGLAIEV